MTEKRTKRRFSEQFKEEAVALVTKQGYSVGKAAQAVGVTAAMLYKWKEKLEAQASGEVLERG